MNSMALVIAGILVVAGLTLIVLSFLVGRSRSDVADAESKQTPAEIDAKPGSAAAVGAFIDEPLASDMAELLKSRKRPAARAQSSAHPPQPSSVTVVPEDEKTEVKTDAETDAETDPSSEAGP